MEQTTHHINGGSALWRRANCPGSMKLELDAPRLDTGTPEASSGTRVHRAVETGDMAGLDADEANAAVACRFVIEQETARASEVRTEWTGEVIDPESGNLLTRGTLDFAALYNGGWNLWDWKTGPGDPPDAESVKWQLSAYGLALTQDTGMPVISACAFHASSGKHTEWAGFRLYSLEEIREVIQDCEALGLSLLCGPWCRYCKAAPCQEVTRQSKALATIMPNDLLTDLPRLLDRAETVSAAIKAAVGVCEAIKSQARLILESGGTVEGWKLKPGRKAIDCTDLNAAHGLYLGIGGTSKQFLAALKGLSLPDLATELARSKGGTAASARREIEAAMAGVLEEKRAKAEVVRCENG